MTITTETRKSFHEALEELRQSVIRLAAMTTEAIAGGTQAFLDADLAAAERVVEADDAIDELTHSIEDQCYTLLARQGPVASDLRVILAAFRISHELERSADLMVNVAKTTRRLYPLAIEPKLRGLIDRMGEQAINQNRVAIDAFADNDPSWAAALADMDDSMDDLSKTLFRHILSSAPADEAWTRLPCAFLQLSAGYAAEAGQAKGRGWPTRRLDLNHLAMLTHADTVARELVSLATA